MGRQYHSQGLKNLSRKLKSRGFEEVGNPGIYASVFQSKNSKQVIKIFDKDDCYEDFIHLIHEHPNKHFPKIRKFATFENPMFKNIYIIKMEKLNPLTNKKTPFNDLNTVIRYISGTRTGTVSEIEVVETFKKLHKSFYDVLILIKQNLRTKCIIDLHLNNIMVRDDGTLVIIDPYFMSFFS